MESEDPPTERYHLKLIEYPTRRRRKVKDAARALAVGLIFGLILVGLAAGAYYVTFIRQIASTR